MKKISLRTWISVLTFVLIGVIIFFSRKELLHAWRLVGQLDWWILLLIVPIVLLGYLAAGEMVFSYLRQKQLIKHVNLWTQMRISLELNFVNHLLPSGGLSGVSYMNWRLSKYGVPSGKATMAQAVRYVAGFASMVTLLVISVFIVTLDGTVNRWIILMSSMLVTIMIIVTLLCVFLMSNVTRTERFAHWIARVVNGTVRRVTFGKVPSVLGVKQLATFLEDMHDDYQGLMRDKRVLLQPFLWGVFFTATEIAIFWVVFWALGSPVNPAPILIAYGLASLTGFFVVTPGGAGAYEAVMILVLSIAGMHKSEAIAGIVLSRVIILLITIVAGYTLYQQVVMKYGKRPDADI